MRKRYNLIAVVGFIAFIAVGSAAFYVGELVNAPPGVYVEHESPMEAR